MAEIIATDEETQLCPRCERSDMVRRYREDYFCERCCAWLSWLERSVEWEKRQRKPVAEAPIPPEPAPETAQSEEGQAPGAEASAPRRKGKSPVQTWECPKCHARYGRPRGAGVCPACAMGESPETVALVPLEEGAT